LVQDILADVKVGNDGQRSGVHGTHALELLVAARVELLDHGGVAIDEQLELCLDPAIDVGDSLNVEAQTAVVGRQGDIEESCREGRVGHARIERARLEDALSSDEGSGGGGEP
jgi:hypothetical protein